MGACRFQLRLRLRNIGEGGGAAVVEILGQHQCPRVVLDSLVKQLLFRVLRTQREIIVSQFGVNRQVERREVRRARLLTCLRRGDSVAHPAPDVDLIGQVCLQIKIVVDRFGAP